MKEVLLENSLIIIFVVVALVAATVLKELLRPDKPYRTPYRRKGRRSFQPKVVGIGSQGSQADTTDATDATEQLRRVMAAEFKARSLLNRPEAQVFRALDEVVPSLMVALENSYDEQSRTRALNGLTGIMRVRSRDLLPYVVPRLLQKPVTKGHAEALAGIAKVTGETIHFHFHSIIPVFLGELANFHVPSEEEPDTEREDAIRGCCEALCGSVDEAGVSSLVSEIASKCSHDKPEMRMECCWLFQTALTERKLCNHCFQNMASRVDLSVE